MQSNRIRTFKVLAGALAALALWPAVGAAQDVSGRASAMRATMFGSTTTLADTGSLSGPDDARGAMQQSAGIFGLGGASTLQAATVSSIWDHDATDYVHSEASLGKLNLGVVGNAISADFVMARAQSFASGASMGASEIANLRVNGSPISVTGAPNQVIDLLGGRITLNEQQASGGGMVVNAMHIVVYGVADVVVGSASSGIGSSAPAPSPSPLPLPLPLPGLGL